MIERGEQGIFKNLYDRYWGSTELVFGGDEHFYEPPDPERVNPETHMELVPNEGVDREEFEKVRDEYMVHFMEATKDAPIKNPNDEKRAWEALEPYSARLREISTLVETLVD